jgi:hypothetical protein
MLAPPFQPMRTVMSTENQNEPMRSPAKIAIAWFVLPLIALIAIELLRTVR